MNIDKFKIEAGISSQESQYILSLTIINISKEVLEFSYSNSTGGFIRNCLNIYDENMETYKYVSMMYINPITYDKKIEFLSKGEQFSFQLNGKMGKDEDGLFIEFKGLSFYVEKGKKYYMQIKYKGVGSNMLEFTID